jgi:hypothetical protein
MTTQQDVSYPPPSPPPREKKKSARTCDKIPALAPGRAKPQDLTRTKETAPMPSASTPASPRNTRRKPNHPQSRPATCNTVTTQKRQNGRRIAGAETQSDIAWKHATDRQPITDIVLSLSTKHPSPQCRRRAIWPLDEGSLLARCICIARRDMQVRAGSEGSRNDEPADQKPAAVSLCHHHY